MKPARKLLFCLIGNVAVLVFVITLIFVFAASDPYWQFGPNPELILIAVPIDTLGKYVVALAVIALIECTRVVVEDIGMPLLGFNIYNPDKKVITEFSKTELQFYGSAMFLTSALRGVFLVMMTISQIDIAVWTVLMSQMATMGSIYVLLRAKRFVPQDEEAGIPLTTPEEQENT